MRAFALVLAVLGAGCGQKLDHPELAPACDATTMKCIVTPPASGAGMSGGDGGASGGDVPVATFNGQLIAYANDTFEQGTPLTTQADVSATGESNARIQTSYDGKAFTLDGVLQQSVNWFLVRPSGSGLLPTLTPVDTRATPNGGIALGVVPSAVIDGVFTFLGTERSTERAQIVLHVVDQSGAAVLGVHAAIAAEKIGYRTAGAWLENDEGTDDSGLILLANLPAGGALGKTVVTLSGTASARVEVAVFAGAVSIATAVVTKK